MTKMRKSTAAKRQPESPAGEGDTGALVERLAGVYRTWILPYSKAIAAVLVIGLAVLTVVKGVESSRVERQGKAFAALAKAEDVDAWMKVSTEHAGTTAAARALLEAGRHLSEERKFEQAATKFALAAKEAVDPSLRTAAALGEAYALEASGRGDVAEKRFTDLAQSGIAEALVLDCWLAAGRCAKTQGKLAETEKYYERARGLVGEDRFAEMRVDSAVKALQSARHAVRATPPKAETAPEAEAAPGEAPPASPAPAVPE
ncbi:MAG: hypothetical protein JXR77_05555 [Lentisphaeria bacterium]|nr:hypothetical protein [Lentisphaeria bacterium]